ncbi:S-formylglutathione hydrolase [Sneathiella chungangensis]|uniref:S-formylglutathione hydrolase n=1 Tax=Sneathiella chungangensis TaxID=1418234 RepID=A0A845MFK8_9PROT|nr:S-formylglutathione hydrolase [Sneathiella chungangensis]MZR22431.1 S-formylglutathione hydrolase [Sneathiella chungangensis]
MKTLSEQACFGCIQGFYAHDSAETGSEMRFAVYLPPAATSASVPVLYYLAGLTCTEETATIKAGAQRVAAEHGLMLVMPDTSPRGVGLPGEEDDWDFGTGAGFYLDAVMEPWADCYRMYSYIRDELRLLINEKFPADPDRTGIFGHSMGGHGALTIALKNPELYKSVSAFAPISSPMQCPWGQKAFTGYLGTDQASWAEYDATALVKNGKRAPHILIDQGTADQFLCEQLKPEIFEAACKEAGQPLTLRRQDGYDHSYYFIQTFMEDHIRHHAAHLTGT